MAKYADCVITVGLTLFGFVLVVTPLALWVALTETIFLVVLVTGATAAALYGVLARFERPPAQSEASDYVRPVILNGWSLCNSKMNLSSKITGRI